MPVTYALHQISNERHFTFHPDDYSRFKFGDEAVAKCFGESLADGFIQNHMLNQSQPQQLVVVSSPYSFIPTATFAMKNHFVFRLNRWLARHGLPVAQEAKVHRTITYKEDYGQLDAEERMKLIGKDSFHMDTTFLKDKTIVFLDDIRITGSHEKMIRKMIRQYALPNQIYLLYFAALINPQVHPSVENFLNYHCVRSVFDLSSIIQSGHFFMNTRFVKYVLNATPADVKVFLRQQPYSFINLLYDMAIGNGYSAIDAYQRNLEWIAAQLSGKESITGTYKIIKN